MILTRIAGLLIGLGWGMFYIGAPMALSERVTDADRGFWFTRFGAFQMAGIGGSPVLLNFLVGQLGLTIESTFLLVGIVGLAAAILLAVFGRKAPLVGQSRAIRPWVRDITAIALGPTIRPILMVGLGLIMVTPETARWPTYVVEVGLGLSLLAGALYLATVRQRLRMETTNQGT